MFRWFDYSRFGNPIDSTRIVAIKTPLRKVGILPMCMVSTDFLFISCQQFNTGRPARLSGDYTKILRGVPIEEEWGNVHIDETCTQLCLLASLLPPSLPHSSPFLIFLPQVHSWADVANVWGERMESGACHWSHIHRPLLQPTGETHGTVQLCWLLC